VIPEVERWRQIVTEELSRQSIPLPVDLILGIIHAESGGIPGVKATGSSAAGLMQVKASNVKWYNEQTGDNISQSVMTSPSGGREQIRVGLWILSHFWHAAYRYLRSRLEEIPTEDLAKIADLMYVIGPGAVRKRLDKLSVPLYPQWEAAYHDLEGSRHPRRVWKQFDTPLVWNLTAISTWLESKLKKVFKARRGGIIMTAAIALAYWFFMRKEGRNDEQKKK
jgi:hypothetical protein